MRVRDRLKHAWDAFRNRDPTTLHYNGYGPSSSYNVSRVYLRPGSEQTIIASIYNRMAIDAAAVQIRHVRIDENGRFTEDIKDSLNDCLTVSPNLDQTPRGFFQDIYLSLFEEGYVAIFPARADLDPLKTGSYDIQELRRGRIIEWMPQAVRLEAYNEGSGQLEEIVLPKQLVAIVENPFYSVMNGHNSTLQRLIHKLTLMDMVDEQLSSEKMNLIIQLPYVIKGDLRKKQAEERRTSIEEQLIDSKYGIAYIDGTERITQLNRPIENNLLSQIEYLNTTLHTQLGITPEILNGTATVEQKLSYNNGTIEPIVSAVADEMKRKFLTKTARTQGQSIMYFRDPFKLADVSQIAEIADKFTRNEILSSNEVRGILGYKPSSDPKADELRNSNISAAKGEENASVATDDEPPQE